MISSNRFFIALTLVAGFSFGASAAPKPVTEKTTPPAKKTADSPAASAIAALLSEYQAAIKENKEDSLRGKSDYFSKQKTAGITAEVVLNEIEKTQSTDPRAD